ncbi:MAG: DNA alkylation repair protein [Nanoarchaeota archaeon]|nr:DNA alkylation repair protein [Nanoarchaeota archaeon]
MKSKTICLITLLKKEMKSLADPIQAKILQRFFKTGRGEYGEGDIFLGIKVPIQRKVAKKYNDMPLKDTIDLLKSKIHEHRLTALFILIDRYKRSNGKDRERVFDLYLKNTKYINNWDLIDLSAPHIIGDYLLDKKRDILYKLAKSKSLWEKRISILSTYTFIRNNEFRDTLKISKMLLKDRHDLIHKGVGWMLREAGKRNQEVEEMFLKKYYKKMPRTMLRYSIERFDENKRKYYMKKD